MAIDLQDIASSTIERMRATGFDSAQVSVSVTVQDELNITTNEASLLRSTEDCSLSITGIVDSRKAGLALTEFGDDAISHGISDLYERALLAPQDEANAVSSGEKGHFEQGPQQGDLDLLVQKVRELLAFRAEETPKMVLEEGAASYSLSREHILTSEGSSLSSSIGCYELQVMGTASEDGQSSSFNYTGGNSNDLSSAHACDLFGIGTMLRETENQIITKPIGGKFVGQVILAPTAVSDLLGWLLRQLGDMALISDGSVYKESVGNLIASPMLSVRSRFDGPGHAAYTGDAFLAPPTTLVDKGRLGSLLLSYYGSRKTNLKHTPSASGWAIDPGEFARQDLISSVKRGALVTRLSMGSPGANGDFSGVIKNSFIIENGEQGQALSESMISGNMAEMLKDISGISKEHLDLGGEDFPWIRIPNLHFS
jgi:PmbA protein